MALGAPRLGFSLHLRAHRLDPGDAEALYYRARAVLALRGPYAAWRFMRGSELPGRAPLEVRADWLALQATVATGFRDFETAELRLVEAEALCPDRPWIAVERTSVLEEQDRLEEALERISATLRESPLFRPGIGASARLLERLGRFEEAVELLKRADAELETGSLAAHLAQILIDLDRPREALAALDRYVALSPLLEAQGKGWVAAHRSDAAYALGGLRDGAARGGGGREPVPRRDRPPPGGAARAGPRPGAARRAVHPAAAPHLLADGARVAHLLLAAAGRPRRARPEDRLRRHAGLPRARVGSRQRLARARVPPDARGGVRAAGPRHPVHALDAVRHLRARAGGRRLRSAARDAAGARPVAAAAGGDDAGAADRAAGLARAALPRARAHGRRRRRRPFPSCPTSASTTSCTSWSSACSATSGRARRRSGTRSTRARRSTC